MGRQKVRQLTLSAWSLAIAVTVVLLVLVTWMSFHFLQPFPPKTIVIATGMEGGSYAAFGESYRQVLARDGIRVVARPTTGAVENMRLLKDRSHDVAAGFMQGMLGAIDEASNLVSLGGIAYTPLWIFYKGNVVCHDLTQLKGKKIAIGPEGSGVRQFSLALLEAAGVTGPPTQFLDLPYAEANRALLDGRADAIMTFGSPDNRLIKELLTAKDVKLMSMSQAEAYSRRFPDLSHVVLPRGVFDPGSHNPPTEVHLLSPTVNLIIRKDLHPALVYVLLKASVEIFNGAGWVNRAGEFPTLTKQDDPISEQARRFYKSGPLWFYAYLPFWAGTFVERVTLILIPLGMIIVPLIGVAPWIYTWRNRKKYYPLYRELRKLEKEIIDYGPGTDTAPYMDRLDRIEEAISRIRTSVAFYDELFFLKEHVQIVRFKLDTAARPSGKGTGDPIQGV
ncbi:MAG TPA: TAXI family TRAP transporter solute-binding subunit [Syntrophorhabdaceae bacterium]|jgi:TRAP transporter TAXI family solute receptor